MWFQTAAASCGCPLATMKFLGSYGAVTGFIAYLLIGVLLMMILIFFFGASIDSASVAFVITMLVALLISLKAAIETDRLMRT